MEKAATASRVRGAIRKAFLGAIWEAIRGAVVGSAAIWGVAATFAQDENGVVAESNGGEIVESVAASSDEPVDCRPVPVDADWWSERFERTNARLKEGNVDVLMVGDSITHYWENQEGVDVWTKYYGDKNAVNLGFAGDKTQHVLWRLEHYDFSAVNPKLAILLIGVNNTLDAGPACDAALGARRVAEKLRALFPETKIIALKIFPCEWKQPQVDAINELLPEYLNGIDNLELLDINRVFLNKDGVVTKAVMYDMVHPTAAGYESWGAALYLKVREALATAKDEERKK